MNDYQQTIRSFKLRNFYSEVHGLIYRQPEHREAILRFAFRHCLQRKWRFEAHYILSDIASCYPLEHEVTLMAEGKAAPHLLEGCDPPQLEGFDTLAERYFAKAKYFRWLILAGRPRDAAQVLSELFKAGSVENTFPLFEELVEITTGEKYARNFGELPKSYFPSKEEFRRHF